MKIHYLINDRSQLLFIRGPGLISVMLEKITDTDDLSRRRILAVASMSSIIGVAGCLGSDDDDDSGDAPGDDGDDTDDLEDEDDSIEDDNGEEEALIQGVDINVEMDGLDTDSMGQSFELFEIVASLNSEKQIDTLTIGDQDGVFDSRSVLANEDQVVFDYTPTFTRDYDTLRGELVFEALVDEQVVDTFVLEVKPEYSVTNARSRAVDEGIVEDYASGDEELWTSTNAFARLFVDVENTGNVPGRINCADTSGTSIYATSGIPNGVDPDDTELDGDAIIPPDGSVTFDVYSSGSGTSPLAFPAENSEILYDEIPSEFEEGSIGTGETYEATFVYGDDLDETHQDSLELTYSEGVGFASDSFGNQSGYVYRVE